MPNGGRELASLDFSALIASPLIAAVEAQFRSAMTTVRYIQQIGFDQDGNVRTVDFSYSANGDSVNLNVPLLAIVPIPNLRIDEVDIQFKARITSIQEQEIETQLDSDASAKLGFKKIFRFKASVSYQRETRQGFKKTSQYSLDVKVRAVQDEIPEGLEKILSMLEESIQRQIEEQTGSETQ